VTLGETLRVRKPLWSWGIDRDKFSDPNSKKGGMMSWRRIVLQTAKAKGFPAQQLIMDDIALQTIYQFRSRSAVPGMARFWLIDSIKSTWRDGV
jgi:hypothetical protein